VGVTADGSFGAKTEAAVKDFQSCFSLTADGIVGPVTWNKINGGCGWSCPLIKRGSSLSACVKVVQRHVGTTVDGAFGSGTERSVKSFQSQNGLSSDGLFGRLSWGVVFGSAGNAATEGPTPRPGGGSGTVITNSCGCNYESATGCTNVHKQNGPTQGALQLRNYIEQKFGKGNSISGIYNCRTVRGGSSYSIHAEGRAVDYFVTVGQGGEDVMNHLISIACSTGIQEVIFNRKRWSKSRGTVYYGGKGKSPHTDHVHVSLNKCGAKSFKYNP
jgi:hypothetical protein